jgi:hypothetical protein
VAALLHEQCLNATNDDPSDTPGFNVAFNDRTAWVGNIDDIIALTISESGRPLAATRLVPTARRRRSPPTIAATPTSTSPRTSTALSAATATSLV